MNNGNPFDDLNPYKLTHLIAHLADSDRQAVIIGTLEILIRLEYHMTS